MYEQPSKQHTDSRPFFVRCLNHSQGKPRTPSQKLERTIKLYFKFEFRGRRRDPDYIIIYYLQQNTSTASRTKWQNE
ncbi:hypothetical protein OIU77_029796 [Salix suchowensis]|uniref:Uncharacterized protein n=1 Tax=Salix suchowensis TaxID=1278906 RepID=A0ABQ9BBN6_9ROSI|nr:hypothetical protein OIU77_029796 [Salix suchowensis]